MQRFETDPDLAFHGALTIVDAPVMHGRLVAALEAGGDVHLDLSDVLDMDLSILQLLIAARAAFERAQTRLTLAPPRFDMGAHAIRCGVPLSLLPLTHPAAQA